MAETIIRFTLVSFASIVIGIILAGGFQEHSYRAGYKKFTWLISIIFSITFGGFILSLFFFNLKAFLNPGPASSIEDIKKMVFSTKANLILISMGAFFGLASVLSIILRIPFSNWTQIKLFGMFEGTRKVEEVKKIANEEMIQLNKLEQIRLEIIDSVASPEFLMEIRRLCNVTQGGTFSVNYGVVDEVVRLIRVALEEQFEEASVRTGVLSVTQGRLDPSVFEYLPSLVKESVHYTLLNEQQAQVMGYGKRYVLSSKYFLASIEEPYFIVYFDVEGITFDNDDILVIGIINKMVDYYLATIKAEIEREVGAVV